jgi:hypothetical protein
MMIEGYNLDLATLLQFMEIGCTYLGAREPKAT